MRPTTRALLVTAFVALLAATAGCTDGGSSLDPSDAPPASELQNESIAVMEGVETVTFTMEMESGTEGQQLTINADGAMDLPARKMRMDMQMNMGREIEATQYIIDNTSYINVNDQWQTRDTGDMNVWGQGNQLATQREALEGATVEITGTDVVNGHDVWIVSVEPDPEALRSLMAQQSGGASLPENVEIENMSFRQYVDAETYHVRQFDMEANVQSQGQTVTVTMQMTFDAFNEPVTIELPEAARQATSGRTG